MLMANHCDLQHSKSIVPSIPEFTVTMVRVCKQDFDGDASLSLTVEQTDWEKEIYSVVQANQKHQLPGNELTFFQVGHILQV